MTALSLCIIAKNEEQQISRCINSAKAYVDQIVVVDTGSADATAQAAKELGAEVYHAKWQDDFSLARNRSLEYAKGDWVLILDCDEELDQNTAPLLKEAIAQEDYVGYWLNCINIYHGRPHNIFQAFRLFRNRPQFRFESPIHEQILPSVLKYSSKEQIGRLAVSIYHYGYEPDAIKQHNKILRNIRLLQKARKQYGDAGFVNYYLGVEYQRLGQWQTARQYFLKSLVNSSDDASYKPTLIKNIAQCCLKLDKPLQALKIIEQYLSRYPDYTDLVYLQGVVLLQLGQYQKALNCMNRCLMLGPSPIKYLSTPDIGNYLPKQFINSVVKGLIDEAQVQIENQNHAEAFRLLNIVFQQLKITPSENTYHALLNTMFYLLNNCSDQSTCSADK